MLKSYSSLKLERRGTVLTIVLDNPPTNAANISIHRELSTIFEDIARDNATRVVVLTGAGTRAFCAGGDFDVMAEQLADTGSVLEQLNETCRMLRSLLALEKPVIARINGHAIGFGATQIIAKPSRHYATSARRALAATDSTPSRLQRQNCMINLV